jgi:hypothetical protein
MFDRWYASPLSEKRSKDGAEVGFILEHASRPIPIEVKWTENPTLQDASSAPRGDVAAIPGLAPDQSSLLQASGGQPA